jgi:hypothetical protein
MLLAGSMGTEEHWRCRSTVPGEAEEAVAGDERAPSPEILDVCLIGVLRGEGKVGVWFPGSDDNGVLGKGGDGENRVEWCRLAAIAGRGGTTSPMD